MVRDARLVAVTWTDSASFDGWMRGNVIVPAEIVTVGLLAEDNEDYTSLFQSASDSGNFAGLFTIPKGCIKEVKVIGRVVLPDLDTD